MGRNIVSLTIVFGLAVIALDFAMSPVSADKFAFADQPSIMALTR